MSKGLFIYPLALIVALGLHLLLLAVKTDTRPLLPEVPAARIAIQLRSLTAPSPPVITPAPTAVRPIIEKENQNQPPPRLLPVKAAAAPASEPLPALPAEVVAPSPSVVMENSVPPAPAGSEVGSPVVAAPPVASRPAPSQLGNYLASVRTQVEAHKDYPAFARQLRLQGTVTVRVEIGSGGRLRAATILASSGHTHLDKAALAAVRNAGRFPAPENFSLGDVIVDIPITFQLI
jgi:protein TonB